MASAAVTAWLGAPRPLRDKIRSFNYRPASWARPDRLDPLRPKGLDLEALRVHPRAERRVSRWLIGRWGLAEPYVFDFDSEAQRLALMPAATLESLSERLGLLRYGPVLRTLIARADRQRVAEALGEERRHYAVSRSRLYMPTSPTDENETMEHRREVPSLAEVMREGWQGLLSCIDTRNPALRRRLELKLPPEVTLDDGAAPAGEDRSPWPLLRRVIKLEFPSEWTACYF